ncbi:MAG: hypothetical protein AAGA69_06470 [Pseudomonadota bacterium]
MAGFFAGAAAALEAVERVAFVALAFFGAAFVAVVLFVAAAFFGAAFLAAGAAFFVAVFRAVEAVVREAAGFRAFVEEAARFVAVLAAFLVVAVFFEEVALVIASPSA